MKHRTYTSIAALGLIALGVWGSLALASPKITPAPKTPAREALAPRKQGSFYLKDGDRVVFYGDSITDQRLYTTYIETYCLTRFPTKHFTFVHSGWGGDRVTGGGGGPIDMRLDRDVLPYKPTVVTICLGMNDASYRAFDQGIFDTYVAGYRHILDRLTKELPGVRITLLTAPAFDDVTRAPGFPGGYNATLVRYGQAVGELAKEYKLDLADTNAPLVAALEKAKASNPTLAADIIKDRVHPGPGGHLVMAAAVLKAWNAPATVADIEINAKSKRVVKQENSRVTGLKATPTSLTFTYRNNALPWPLDRDPDGNKDMALALQVTDIEQTLNHYVVKITGLTADRYSVKIDGADFGIDPASYLAAGVDVAAVPNLPDNVQAREVLNLTRQHNDLRFKAWRQIRDPKNPVTPDIQKQIDELTGQETDLVKKQQEAAQPLAHTVELTAVP